MEDLHLFFSVPKHLNKGKRIVGLPIDEVVPAALIFLIFFIAKHQMIGLIIGGAWFSGLRYIKVQFGDNIITLALYWWGTAAVNHSFFKRTPASRRRYWIF
ncbi:type IV conjugative transfer system protein TraL [Vibrio genomosp. F6]|jgi:conjugal transfer pilus assembly protein TraL|uniref:Protein TraL n=2 Tax=Vibrio genomosp. F6 TaxID=723172 RepID=A0A1E5CSD5_9VIBR|nr:type IV conjugative transfer system protein TraL [Vibrio genomosp. F6]AKN39089.1 IncF plasmid conjugative transfer pilus assemblyprotein TraL [Vibrio genomosp. F6]AKN39390.1 IncF plasmid conjugative transfer pilus assemblyprotein TraL [Vibrio genomosp. F6]OEE72835.1 type IV conjugative transfer system protein TraL [Vibrio genomosp. F6 str. FF-238]